MGSPGRKTKCTSSLTDKICQVLRAGNYIKVACEYVGIGESTYHLWVDRGRKELERVAEDGRRSIRKPEQPFVEFMESVTRARASAEVESVARIRKAASEDWRADAWFLEHSFPDRWGRRRQEVDITSNGDHINDPLAGLSVEDKTQALRARLEQLEESERIEAENIEVKGIPDGS